MKNLKILSILVKVAGPKFEAEILLGLVKVWGYQLKILSLHGYLEKKEKLYIEADIEWRIN